MKVKFIHLSDAAPSNIYIKDSNGETIVSNLTINIESGYSTFDPGALSLQLYIPYRETALVFLKCLTW
ncbi:DUF4397 domain-containing protein [Ohtaekwangia koreensis]|uniref:DUF4397 domain-containing protein n=1 Tax=Ohtaekwangia koreensis TaxID=688867 RepID=UPI0009A586B1|nr:DUF4397 domain-containing protein [Ohtaekwangia koreensis]